jgi:hypothetical protein
MLKEDPNGKLTNGHSNCVSSLAISQVGGNLISGSYDNSVKV